MKNAQFIKALERKGVEVFNRTRHKELRYKGRITFAPRHPGKEISNNFARTICRQLGLDFPLK